MFKRAIAAFGALLICAASAFAAPPSSAGSDLPRGEVPVQPPGWVKQSNRYAQVLLGVMGEFDPESASDTGLNKYDDKVVDLKPGVDQRRIKATTKARTVLRQDLAGEKNPHVRQDLEIMIVAAGRKIDSIKLHDQYLLPYKDVGHIIFFGEFTLLNPEADPSRHDNALVRLKCYVGMAPGCTPVTKEAEALFDAKAGDRQLLGPYRGAVEYDLTNTQRYVEGIRKLYVKYKIVGAGPALDALQQQLDAYDAWVRSTVLPRARADARFPEPIYIDNLKNVGVDIPPRDLIKQAETSFLDIQAQMETLAPYVAKAKGFAPTSDYRAVIKDLKKQQLDSQSIMPYYRHVLAKQEASIHAHHLVTLPKQPMIIRLASEAESAADPSPHMDPPPLINNHGELGTFVLPLGNPTSGKGKNQAYDDFTCKACAWSTVAHEGRPGHDLQFAAMVDHGVSLARTVFAFNSVNVEGWALYSEWMMQPYEPPGGQMIALQMRLLRAARAFLDPMLNLGLITRQRAHDILVNDVGISEAFAREELDRYTFRAPGPGQAAAYFYGYSRLLELRAHAEIVLGDKFNLQQFNDFILAQGPLPPNLLAESVDNRFIPAHDN